MKKVILLLGLVIAQLSTIAQTVNIHFKNGQVIKYPAGNVEYVDFSSKNADPSITESETVDLGLSVYWASFNLGADSPEKFGNYYSWGEVSPKKTYMPDNYTYYDNNKEEYISIGEDISDTEYDAAAVALGKGWRMPRKKELAELVDKCKWEWTQINGVNGFKVTGTNGNSIFLPSASNSSSTSGINYVSSTESSKSDCWTVIGRSDMNPTVYSLELKWVGHTIRPVKSK